jgi:hypothetical protein
VSILTPKSENPINAHQRAVTGFLVENRVKESAVKPRLKRPGLDAMQALSQLSYRPNAVILSKVKWDC